MVWLILGIFVFCAVFALLIERLTTDREAYDGRDSKPYGVRDGDRFGGPGPS